MSRIGRMPVAIPAGVTVTIAEGNKVTVKGPKGTLERELPVELTIEEKDGHVIVSRPNDLKRMKSLHGLTRTLINNMIHGVTEGYEKVLEVNGVGYRAAKQGKKFLADLASDSEDSGAEKVGAAPRSAEGEDADETGKTPEARMAAARANVAELFGKKKEG